MLAARFSMCSVCCRRAKGKCCSLSVTQVMQLNCGRPAPCAADSPLRSRQHVLRRWFACNHGRAGECVENQCLPLSGFRSPLLLQFHAFNCMFPLLEHRDIEVRRLTRAAAASHSLHQVVRNISLAIANAACNTACRQRFLDVPSAPGFQLVPFHLLSV